MAPESSPRGGRRTWGILVGAVVLVFLLILVFGMLSEREDARRLPPGEVERRGEEPWTPP
ncbi:hypothetical protein BH23GEM3_BH23GEM3_20500 [soil metagenome]|jgi:hypothetical protein|nr:hypothetical protein [Gemmatimonadota bacterium]